MLDFIRIACAVPAVKVGDVKKNAQDICDYIEKADAQGTDILLMPELAITGYTCGDLFFQDALWNGVKDAVKQIAFASGKHPELTVVVGLPVRIGHKLYNCAAVIARGEVCGIVPKTHLTTAEKRWFASANQLGSVYLAPQDIGLVPSEDYWTVPVSAKQLFCLGDDAVLGVEICQDGMVPQPCSAELAVNGAEVLLNLSASHELVGKRSYRRELIKHNSESCTCIYALASAGYTESTSDLVYSGHSVIAENGNVMAENENLFDTDYMIVADCDLGRVRADRNKIDCFDGVPAEDYLETDVYGDFLRSDGVLYPLRKLAFVPNTREERIQRCLEIFQTQVTGLKQRLKTINSNAVIGISGGLDSTLALLVAVEAMRQLLDFLGSHGFLLKS